MIQPVRVKGLRELLWVTDRAPKDVRKGVRDELRKVAVPVRDEANARFVADVSPDRRQTRYGISVRRTGVVSVEQRKKASSGNRALKRPNFTELQWQRALGPAAVSNEDNVVRALDGVLADLERKWNLG